MKSVLKPIKAVDQEVLRWYTRTAMKFPEKYVRKTVAPLCFGGAVTFAAGLESLGVVSNNIENVPGWIYSILFQNDLLDGSYYTKEEDISEESIKAVDFHTYVTRNIINRTLRLPILAAGIFNTVSLGMKVVDVVANGTPLDISQEACLAAGGLCSASSMYLKDRNPKLLDREPAWKRAYEAVKEKAKSLVPQPAPQPVPVRVNANLEERI